MPFVKGGPGGPGRPKGSKNKLQEAFWKDLFGVWEETGIEAIKAMALDDPGRFVATVASLMPKALEAEVSQTLTIEVPWTVKPLGSTSRETSLSPSTNGTSDGPSSSHTDEPGKQSPASLN